VVRSDADIPKLIEWKKPLWPKKLSYGTPSLKPITSKTGKTEKSIPVNKSCQEIFSRKAAFKERASAGCENTVGII